MKITIYTLFIFATVSFAQAKILTVSNDPAQPAQFNTIAVAIDSAKANDTIYISGSNFQYPLINVTKSNLTLIGAGFNPNKQNAVATTIEGLSFSGTFQGQIKANLNFLGIEFVNRVVLNQTNLGTGTVRNVSFIRCSFIMNVSNAPEWSVIFNDGSHNYNQFIFKECLFRSNIGSPSKHPAIRFSNSIGLTNILITNCVFYGQGDTSTLLLSFSNLSQPTTNNVIFSNNIFHKGSGSSNLMNISGIPRKGFTFSNNIFDGINPIHPLMQNSSYFNNIINTAIDLNNPTSISTVGSGNIINQNPLLVNLPALTNFSVTHNFNLQPTSPFRGTGLNGADMGVMGGNGKYRNDGEPFIPQIDEFIIFNPIVPQGTSLQIRIKGTSLDK